MTVDSLLPFNVVWYKANARIDYVQTTEGEVTHAMKHTEAGQTNNTVLHYDDENPAPTFLTGLSAVLNTKVSKWLSGIEAWGLGTTIDISYEAASGIFRKAYHNTAVGSLSGDGYTSSDDNPSTVPNVDDTFLVSKTIDLDVPNVATLTPTFQVTIRKPNSASANSNTVLSTPINTYGIVSTSKTEQFFDEARRIELNTGNNSGDATPWNSQAALLDDNAQQRHNGYLQYPDPTEYPGFDGDQEYQRFIEKVTASSGALTLSGISYTDIDPYGTGDLNVLIHLTGDNRYFDFGRAVGDDNGTGTGVSRINSIGAKNEGASSGSTLVWSIGTYSTAFNGNEYRLIIIFRNSNHSIISLSEV